VRGAERANNKVAVMLSSTSQGSKSKVLLTEEKNKRPTISVAATRGPRGTVGLLPSFYTIVHHASRIAFRLFDVILRSLLHHFDCRTK